MSDAPPEAPAPSGPGRSGAGGSVTSRAIILAVVAITLFVALAVPVRTWFAQRAEIAQLRADVESTRDRVAALQLEQGRWDDPAYVAAEARRRLHFVLPGEVGYVTLGVQTPEEQVAAAEANDDPWFDTLWGAVRESDSPSEDGADGKGSADGKSSADDNGEDKDATAP